MIHGSGSGLLDLVLRRYTFLEGKVDPLISLPKSRLAGEGRSAYFGCQNGALLWRADPSFRNSVTGSGSIAKCSNILQDMTNMLAYQGVQCCNKKVYNIRLSSDKHASLSGCSMLQ
jgi:hypothetical protein